MWEKTGSRQCVLEEISFLAEKELVKRILGEYIPEFVRLERELKRHYGDGLGICTEGSGNLDEGAV